VLIKEWREDGFSLSLKKSACTKKPFASFSIDRGRYWFFAKPCEFV